VGDAPVSAVVLADGHHMVSYVDVRMNSHEFAVVRSPAGAAEPLGEALMASGSCTGDQVCRQGAMAAWGEVFAAVFLIQQTDPPVHTLHLLSGPPASMPRSLVASTQALTAPVAVAVDADETHRIHLLYTHGSVLTHRPRGAGDWSGDATAVVANAVRAAVTVDGQGQPWVVAVDGDGLTSIVRSSAGLTDWTPEVVESESRAPGSGVDIVVVGDGTVHACTQRLLATGAELVHVSGRPGRWERRVVESRATSEPGGHCRVAVRALDGEVLLSHVDGVTGRLRLSRLPPGGSWGTDDVDAATVALGPHALVLDGVGVAHLYFPSTAGRMKHLQ
jgi:hypothetical protein